MTAVKDIPVVIMACCVLHNIILENEGIDEDYIDLDPSSEDPTVSFLRDLPDEENEADQKSPRAKSRGERRCANKRRAAAGKSQPAKPKH